MPALSNRKSGGGIGHCVASIEQVRHQLLIYVQAAFVLAHIVNVVAFVQPSPDFRA